MISENPPTIKSVTDRLITRYILRLRRLLFFIKTITVRTLNVTIATDSVINPVSQAMHSGEEKGILKSLLASFRLLMRIINRVSAERKE